ncbi:hypothetical protein M3A96_02485 [Helcobacillus massiliensis]|nr:hypothetical protein [Helcobacillus massiliensis]MCT1556995.1 hypothetical protein [Helcobacillus massiliensis]MCT2035384.1 hypothetical protein [Helcobacillus massiliensis]MCT2331401.1 hypothetical protein [Helcobacillus massiliensis]
MIPQLIPPDPKDCTGMDQNTGERAFATLECSIDARFCAMATEDLSAFDSIVAPPGAAGA